jgi:thioredoxin reductase
MADPIYDVAIVGGGPAGQAAADRLIAAGLTICMIDEQQRPGGQILRQPPLGHRVAGWMASRLYRTLKAQLHRIEGSSALDFIGGTSVLGLWREACGFRLSLGGQRTGHITAHRVLVAAGCYDMPVPLPGWTLPGVMSAGGLQTLLKGQQIVPGQAIILFGTHPLMLVLAQQLVEAGATVRAVLFAQPLADLLRVMPRHALAALRHAEPLLAALHSWRALRRAGVPLRFGTRVERLVSADGALAGADIVDRGATSRIDGDIAAMCFGFLPQSDLPRTAGADIGWSDPTGGWETIHDPAMRTSVPCLYVAGETSGVTGADAALVEGALAGLTIATDAGRLSPIAADRLAAPLRHQRARLQGFIELLRAVADPRAYLPAITPDTLVCRCEDVSAATLDAAIADAVALGAPVGASAVKLRCRAGMGLCQGRSCERSVMQRIAAATGAPLATMPGFRPRYPARPMPIADLIDPA